MKGESTDILAIGVHPDDVELGCAGTLLRQIELGNSIVIADLTEGDLGTRGSNVIRRRESDMAAKILGISDRQNLKMRDGFFRVDEEHILSVVSLIRKYKPRIVLCNAIEDRHPDHGRAAELISQACFYSGLRKIETKEGGKVQHAWRPVHIYHYVQFKYLRPDFLVDITPYYDTKMKAVKAYKSQFYDPKSDEPETMISSKAFLDFLDARMIEFGRIIGVRYAEGFTVKRIPAVEDLNHLK